MGGHGAWMNAVNHPDTFSCIAPAAGWIRWEAHKNMTNCSISTNTSYEVHYASPLEFH